MHLPPLETSNDYEVRFSRARYCFVSFTKQVYTSNERDRSPSVSGTRPPVAFRVIVRRNSRRVPERPNEEVDLLTVAPDKLLKINLSLVLTVPGGDPSFPLDDKHG